MERYDHEEHGMESGAYGDWVKWEDAHELEEDVERLRGVLDAMRDAARDALA